MWLRQCPRHTDSASLHRSLRLQLVLTANSAARRDMPPPGGFQEIRYKRNLPFRGPSGAVILAGVTAFCAFGFYRLGLGNLEKR